MNDEMRGVGTSDTEIPSRKRVWTQPRIETVAGREARGSVFRYGGPDNGFYS